MPRHPCGAFPVKVPKHPGGAFPAKVPRNPGGASPRGSDSRWQRFIHVLTCITFRVHPDKDRAPRPSPETVDGRNFASGNIQLLCVLQCHTVQPPVPPVFNVGMAASRGGGVTWKIFCQSTLKCGGRGEVGAGAWQWMCECVCRMRLLPTGKISSIHRRGSKI